MGNILVIKGADFSAVSVGKVTLTGKIAITVVASPTGGGTTTGSGSYNEGDTVIITATANSGYTFKQWSDGNTNVSRTITVGISAMTYTAEFFDVVSAMLETANRKIRASVNTSVTPNTCTYETHNNRITFSYGLTHEILTEYSHIKVSVNSNFTVARQFFEGIGTDDDWKSGTSGNLGTLISDSSTWLSTFEEDIPENAVGMSLVLNCGTQSGEDISETLDLSTIGLTIELS